MKGKIKNILKKIYHKLFDKTNQVTLEQIVFDINARYDCQTNYIISQLLKVDSNSIDVGAHRGDILINMIKAAPEGKHFAFEPLPELYDFLKTRFNGKATVYPFALGNENGKLPFNHVTTNPAYSGLLKRKYARPEMDESIEVEVRKLDEIIPIEIPITFIKIDVEGAEFGVLRGAAKILRRWKPVLIYEQGLGASEIYDTQPGEFYDFMKSFGYQISLMEYYINKKQPMDRDEYCKHFEKGYDYYYIAY